MSTNGLIIPGYPTTTAEGIVLVFNGLTLTVESFGTFPGRYPRVDAQAFGIEYSYRGNASREGTLFRPKALFTFDAKLSLEQQATRARMEARYFASPATWTLYDYTQPIADSGSRTRALAPNSTADTTSGDALYYAGFNVEPVRAAEVVEQNARYDLVSFQFAETGGTTP